MPREFSTLKKRVMKCSNIIQNGAGKGSYPCVWDIAVPDPREQLSGKPPSASCLIRRPASPRQIRTPSLHLRASVVGVLHRRCQLRHEAVSHMCVTLLKHADQIWGFSVYVPFLACRQLGVFPAAVRFALSSGSVYLALNLYRNPGQMD